MSSKIIRPASPTALLLATCLCGNPLFIFLPTYISAYLTSINCNNSLKGGMFITTGKKIRLAIVGLGNVGKGALDAVQASPDMELAGVVVREQSLQRTQAGYPTLPLVSNIQHLGPIDVAVLALPSRIVPAITPQILAQGINTVDCYDIGHSLWQLRTQLDVAAKATGATAISAAGWDPGTNSLIRAIFALQAPCGTTYTNFGPGMSMGHTAAAKRIAGVKDALSLTIPQGQGKHRRLVYIELSESHSLTTVNQAILQDPYFSHDETRVQIVNDVQAMMDTNHGALIEHQGTSGSTPCQSFRYELRINNPALTGQILIAAARATQQMQPGAYTMLEVPLAYFLPGSIREIIASFA